MQPAYGSQFEDNAVIGALDGIAQQAQAAQAHGGPPALCVMKNSLNGGELAPELSCRYDLPRFQMGCEELLNFVPLPGGGITRRPGFQFVSGTNGGKAARLLPFIYSASLQFMVMVLANDGNSTVFILDRDGSAGARETANMPYVAAELPEVCFCQCGKVIYIAHKNHAPAKLVYDGETFSYEKLNFRIRTPIPQITWLQYYGPWDSDNIQLQEKTWITTAVDPVTGEESLPSAPWSMNWPALNANANGVLTIEPLPGISEYRVYKKKGGEYGFIGRITEGNTFRDDGIAPDMTDQPPRNFEGFQKPGDYPSIVFLHQQRLGWAASDNDPLTIWMSQTSNFECMASKTPPADDDAIEVTLASAQANRILWCVSDRSGLAVGTEGEEWYLTGADGAGTVTPSSLSFQPQTRYGTEQGTRPVRANASLIFCQRGGRVIRDLGYSYAVDRYEAKDLTLMAGHIFRLAQTRIVDMCWQGSPYNVLWCVNRAGSLAGLTYLPENEVSAWHRHLTAGHILSCASLDDSEGKSRLWLVVRREEGVHVEIMGDIYYGQAENGSHEIGRRFLDGQAARQYTSRCIPWLPESGMENGATSMRVKRINAIKARVMHSWPFTCQVCSQNAEPSREQPVPALSPSTNARLSRRDKCSDFTDWACPIGAGFRDNAKLVISMTGPGPLTILGLAISMEIAREGRGQI